MTLEGLEVLCSVAHEGSINGAARALDLSPSTAWRRLRQLEQDMGCRLVERTPTHVRLTQAGREAYRHGRELLQDASTLRDAVQAVDRGLHGELRIGLLPVGSFEPVFFAWDRLAALRPGLRVVLVESPEALHPLRDDLDLVVTHAVPDDPGLFVQRIAAMRVGLFASPDLPDPPRTPDDVASHDLAVHHLPPEPSDALPLWAGGQLAARPRLSTTSPTGVLQWVRSGRGLGLVAAPSDDRGLVPVLPDEIGFERSIYLVAGLRRRDSARLQLVEQILAWIQPLLDPPLRG